MVLDNWKVASLLVGLVAAHGGCLSNRCLELGEGHFLEDEGLLYPLQDGAWWRMRVTDDQSGVADCPDKVVSVGPEMPIPLRDWVTAFQVYSVREDEWGIRWQAVQQEDRSIVRHLDEWYLLPHKDDPASADRLRIKYYCPYKDRAADGDRARLCGDWETTRWEFTITLNSDDPANWSLCEAIQIDHLTCAPLSPIPSVCTWDWDMIYEEFVVQAVEEQLTVPAFEPSTVPTLKIARYEESLWKDEYESDTYWWHRGVGKIAKDDDTDYDSLVAFCLPDASTPDDYQDCIDSMPTKEAMIVEACPPPRTSPWSQPDPPGEGD